jgi:hypothetical protein
MNSRDGNIRHVMPAVDIRYESPSTTASASSSSHHRNRGLCSVPRAYQWIDYSQGLSSFWLKDLELRAWKRKMKTTATAVASTSDGGDNNNNNNNDDDDVVGGEESCWMELASATMGSKIVQGIESVQYALMDDPPPELGEGSHIVHVLLESVWDDNDDETNEQQQPQQTYSFDYPKTGYELCVVLEEKRESNLEVVVEQPPERKNIRAPYASPTAYGILHVGVSATMAGSESEYLPEVYRPLYEDMTLRNPIYMAFKEKQQQQQQQRRRPQQQNQ